MRVASGVACRVVHQETRCALSEAKKSFVLYVVRVSHQGLTWLVGRRYQQFWELQQWLATNDEAFAATLPSFPSKLGGAALRLSKLDAWLSALSAGMKGRAAARVSEWLAVEPRPLLLYKTSSLCGVCMVGEGRAVELLPAQVVARKHAVYLECPCSRHGLQTTLYCSDQYFFERMMSFALPGNVRVSAHEVDVEEMGRRMMYDSPDPALPLLMELAIVKPGSTKLLETAVVMRELGRLRSMQGKRRFVLRCAAKGCEDMDALNALLLEVALHDLPVLVEATLERLVLLCGLEKSVFLHSNAFPGAKLLVEPGTESQCLRSAVSFLESARQFRGIRVVLTLSFDALPDLSSLCEALLQPQTAGLLRVLVLSPQRSPSRLMASARAALPQQQQPKVTKKEKQEIDDNPFMKVIPVAAAPAPQPVPPPQEMSVDISAAVHSLKGLLSPLDFFPISVLTVVTPLLRIIGVGPFSIRPHPLCGMVAFLIPIGDKLLPISRFLDVSAFFAGMAPLLPQLNATTEMNWNLGRKLRSVFQDSLMPGAEQQIPDVISFLVNPEKAAEAQQLLERAILVVVHNNMDLMAMDLARRCDCASVSSTPLTQNNLSAQCLGCL